MKFQNTLNILIVTFLRLTKNKRKEIFLLFHEFFKYLNFSFIKDYRLAVTRINLTWIDKIIHSFFFFINDLINLQIFFYLFIYFQYLHDSFKVHHAMNFNV